MREPVILGIETTCDDSGIGVFKNGKIIANTIISSTSYHQQFGGVVPEIAAREHEKNLTRALNEAMNASHTKFDELTHIAYASEPGLPGSLHVGKIFAKTLGLSLHLPMLPVNHLYGHLYSGGINQQPIIYPAMGIVVSGGHTAIYLIKNALDIQLLDQTTDDAIGEVYDKVGRSMNLNYPAGPAIDKLFDPLHSQTIQFIKKDTDHSSFSYSGFKTAVLNYLHNLNQRNESIDLVKVASSFQYWIMEDLLKRVKFYLNQHEIKMIALGGGVSANSYLRNRLKDLHPVIALPSMEFTNDNGAMHAYYASILLQESKTLNIPLPFQIFKEI
ncbi:tRNA (adenosine(37)-N6)-threonylcarbamoyltransferase complex transferase subunit TsaD [[Mycoplasma] testudinis]|uniref:tRNA (adenosine(37)-N6)-threonylcarbamoyltransferase complex transferase subunit TsaD n=1 Tax=[Mycoplasma] testudinis TaxID=33924 RepID=UPI00048A27D8|nr:tRNA (adenosine(37)-N6)-threonylcarbamoyltransferase complex transferase subunit TsaD [[Mycoplasma] testudinis]